MTGIFITATDTGVGKTSISAALANRLRSECSVAVFKPVETGGTSPRDASMLTKFASLKPNDKALSNVYHFQKPVTPMLAAELEGVTIKIDRIVDTYTDLEQKYDFVIVEGVGGIASPISSGVDNIDLASALDLSVLVVSKAGLGAISQSVVAVRYALSRRVSVKAIILNKASKSRTLAEKTNPGIIQGILNIPVFVVPEFNARGSKFVSLISIALPTGLLEILR